jgi:hypothetical protein
MSEFDFSGGDDESDLPIFMCALAAVAAIAGAGYFLGKRSGAIATADILNSLGNRVKGLG